MREVAIGLLSEPNEISVARDSIVESSNEKLVSVVGCGSADGIVTGESGGGDIVGAHRRGVEVVGSHEKDEDDVGAHNRGVDIVGVH